MTAFSVSTLLCCVLTVAGLGRNTGNSPITASAFTPSSPSLTRRCSTSPLFAEAEAEAAVPTPDPAPPANQDPEAIARVLPSPLIDPKGNEVDAATIAEMLQGHRVALYFGAGWCPMCRELEMLFPQYRDALKDSGQPIQLIYVSSDRSEQIMLDRMQTLNFLPLAVPFGNNKNKNKNDADAIKAKYRVWSGMEKEQFSKKEGQEPRRSGVPAFVVLDTDGEELMYLDAESNTIAALGDWPMDDPKGHF